MQEQATLEELVARHPFVSGLDAEFLMFLYECASLRRFGSQQHIFQEGGEADHLYLILTGKVTLGTTVPKYGPLPIQTLGPGDALGWSWLIPPHNWCFTAATAVPTDVLSFGAKFLRQKASENPYFANELLTRIARTLVQRVRATRDQLVHVYGVMNEHKIAA